MTRAGYVAVCLLLAACGIQGKAPTIRTLQDAPHTGSVVVSSSDEEQTNTPDVFFDVGPASDRQRLSASGLASSIASLVSDAALDRQQMVEVKTNVTRVEASLAATATDVTELGTGVSNLEARFGALESTTMDAKANITQAQSLLSQLDTALGSVQTAVGTKASKTALDGVDGALQNLIGVVGTVETDLGDVTARVDALEVDGSVSALEARVVQLETTMAEAASNITDLQALVAAGGNGQVDLVALQENVLAMQAQLDSVFGTAAAKCDFPAAAFGSTWSGTDISTTTWTKLNGLNPVVLESFGEDLRVQMNFNVYGVHHGGIRIIMDGTTVFGRNPTYGMEWVIPHEDNRWYKRTITRVMTGIPAGIHSFEVEVRAQSASRFYIHGGDQAIMYSGFHINIERVSSDSSDYCYVHDESGDIDIGTTTWTALNIPTCSVSAKQTEQYKVNMDFSIYGTPHGGVRLKATNTDGQTLTFGPNPTYGFDWVLPSGTNYWRKRNLQRIIDLPAGTWTFAPEFRSQSDGSRFYVAGGETTEDYAGFHMIVERLNAPSPSASNAKCPVRKHCYTHQSAAQTTTSASWTSANTVCSLTTTRTTLRFYIDVSARSSAVHGGIRLVMDGSVVFGQQTTYGLDWLIDFANTWEKQSLSRTITVPAGSHTFELQFRSQSTGVTTELHGGDADTDYSGIHLMVEEL